MAADPDWSADAARSHAFRALVAAVAGVDSYTAAIEAAARPIAVGSGSAVVLGLLDRGRDVVHALGIHDPSPDRADLLETLSQVPFERRGAIGGALEQQSPVTADVDEDDAEALWPGHAQVVRDFGLRHMLVAPFRTQDGELGMIWAARAEQEPPFSAIDTAFLRDCGMPLALAVHAGLLREALERTAGRRAPVARDVPPPPGGERRRRTVLSAREADIQQLLEEGRTNREVADELGLSPRTVEWHRARIQWKLAAR